MQRDRMHKFTISKTKNVAFDSREYDKRENMVRAEGTHLMQHSHKQDLLGSSVIQE